jgi:flavorubredoxin
VVTVRGEFTDGVRWLKRCYDDDHGHEHVAAYLLSRDDHHVLVDSGSHHYEDDLVQILTEHVGDGSFDAVVLSHPDLPHSANIRAVQAIDDDVELICANSAPEVVGLPARTRVAFNETMQIGTRDITFLESPLADIIFTTWPYDHETGVIFTADGFGLFHDPGECDRVFDTDLDGLTVDDLATYHRHSLRWLELIDPTKLMAHLRQIFDERDISYVAPAHGSPIAGHLLPEYFDMLETAIEQVAAERKYRVET